MKFYTIQPSQRLANFVSYFWVAEFDGLGQETYTYLSTADSCPKLIFPYKLDTSVSKDESFFSSGIQGQTQWHGQFPTPERFGMFGVYLFPYAIAHLFALPACELSNQFLDWETLLGEPGKELVEKMDTATDTGQRISIITDFFEHQLARHFTNEIPIISAIQYIRRQKGLINILEISQQYCLSQKQFERKFQAFSGFTPKLYARIVRFETVLQNYQLYSSLTELGYACGYYDQSHFIHDFKAFSGHHPKSYFAALPHLE